MRLLIISQYFYPEEFKINRLTSYLAGEGYAIDVLTGQPNYPSGRRFPGYSLLRPLREQYEGKVSIIRVPLFTRHGGQGWQLALNYLTFAVSATLIGLPRLRHRYDACLVFCPSPLTAAIPGVILRSYSKTPVAIWLQDLWPDSVSAVRKNLNPVVTRVLLWLARWIYTHSDQIWLQSPAYRGPVEALGGRTETFSDVPNWADDFYSREKWADVQQETLPPNSLVFAGTLGRSQGLGTLIDAASILKLENTPAHFVFAGDGSMREWLRAEILRRSLVSHVSLLPRRPAKEMPSLLKSASALLISLADEPVFAKTIPSKVQSCLAAGRPIIASSSGESARIIKEAGCGYVCPPHDARSVAQAVKRLLAMPTDEREALGRRAHAYYVKHFTESKILAQISVLLSTLKDQDARSLG